MQIKALDKCNVKQIAAGERHSLCVDGDGNLLAFGVGNYGQLGCTDELPARDYCEGLPVNIDLKDEDGDKVIQISCGENHNFAITNKGSVYTWGYGTEYELGHGVGKDEYRPRKLEAMKGIKDGNKPVEICVHQAEGGAHFSAILCKVIREN